MMPSPVWVDLSTYDCGQALQFYRALFNWRFWDDGAGYWIGTAQGQAVAGIYEMPAFFQQIKMPSFWMSYFQVADAAGIATRARSLGAKVELEDRVGDAQIALIRDPAGAGFTCYDGGQLQSTRERSVHGHWYWNELLVSDLDRVRGFYADLFGWQLQSCGYGRYLVYGEDGQALVSIQVAPNSEKGDKEYWAIHFAVDDVAAACAAVETLGGSVATSYQNDLGTHYLVYDAQGAAFCLSQTLATE